MFMEVPSGILFSDWDEQILRLMHRSGFIEYSENPFTLKSGVQSNVYVHGRGDFTGDPQLEWSVGERIAEQIHIHTKPEDGRVCLVGLPTAGTPFAQAAAMVAFKRGITPNRQAMIHQLMKEKPKNYGANTGWFNGKPSPDQIYWRIDNVATNGATKIELEDRFAADGYPTVHDNPDKAPVYIWIDRQQGAIKRLREAGYTRIEVGYNLLDITFAYGAMGLWPKSAVKAVEEEIKAHQAL
jgi:orotate phosphoribosyltransferase